MAADRLGGKGERAVTGGGVLRGSPGLLDRRLQRQELGVGVEAVGVVQQVGGPAGFELRDQGGQRPKQPGRGVVNQRGGLGQVNVAAAVKQPADDPADLLDPAKDDVALQGETLLPGTSTVVCAHLSWVN